MKVPAGLAPLQAQVARWRGRLPQRNKASDRFFIMLLLLFLVLYPLLDPVLLGNGTDGRISLAADTGRYIVLALGLNIVVGFAGLLDLGYVAFFAIGAYAWAIFGSTQLNILTGIVQKLPGGLPWAVLFWPMLLGAAFIAAFFGILLGAPTLRLRGDYLAIVTLGFGEIVPIVFLNSEKITNGTNGINGVPGPVLPCLGRWTIPLTQIRCDNIPFTQHHLLGIISFTVVDSTPYYYLAIALVVLVVLANIRLRDSRLGRAWMAMREDEIAASCSGVNLVATKLSAFAAGAFFSGIAGAFHASKLGIIAPDNFSFGDSVIYLAMVVLGGMGSIPGVIVGAIGVVFFGQYLLPELNVLKTDPHGLFYFARSFDFINIRNLLFGLILIAVMVLRPEGLIPSARRKMELHRAEVENESVELGSLDAPVGAGADKEVRVE